MRLAETVRSSTALGFLAGAGIVVALAVRPTPRLATPPIVQFDAPHELTMSLEDDCASDVAVVNGRYVVTLEMPDHGNCTKSVRVYHLENDHLVSD
ncbi:MAG TPA: hypothetical protein VGG28_22205 [Kofleriaceae bacterium]|jgi:hypothetical protein